MDGLGSPTSVTSERTRKLWNEFTDSVHADWQAWAAKSKLNHRIMNIAQKHTIKNRSADERDPNSIGVSDKNLYWLSGSSFGLGNAPDFAPFWAFMIDEARRTLDYAENVYKIAVGASDDDTKS